MAEQIESLHWLRANFDDPNWAKVWIRSYFKKRAELFKLERLAIEWMTKKLGETGDSRPIFSTLLRTRRTKLDVVSILTRKIREAQQHPERWLPYLMQLPTEAATPEIIDFCQYALSSYVEGQRPPDVSIEDVVGTWQLVSRSNLRASIFAEITWSMLTDVKLPPRRKLQFWKFLRAEPDHRDRLIVFGRQWLTRLRSENPGVFARVWVDLTDDTGSIEEIEGALYWLHELHHAAQWPEIWRRLLGQMGTQEASDLAKRWLHSLRSTSSRWSTGWLTIQATLPADEDIKQMGHHWLTSGGASRKGGRAVLERLRDLRMDL